MYYTVPKADRKKTYEPSHPAALKGPNWHFHQKLSIFSPQKFMGVFFVFVSPCFSLIGILPLHPLGGGAIPVFSRWKVPPPIDHTPLARLPVTRACRPAAIKRSSSKYQRHVEDNSSLNIASGLSRQQSSHTPILFKLRFVSLLLNEHVMLCYVMVGQWDSPHHHPAGKEFCTYWCSTVSGINRIIQVWYGIHSIGHFEGVGPEQWCTSPIQ